MSIEVRLWKKTKVFFRWVFCANLFLSQLGRKIFSRKSFFHHHGVFIYLLRFIYNTLYLNPLRSCLTTAMEFKITLMILPWFLCTIGWLLLRWWSTIHILTTFHFLNERQPIIFFFIEISEVNETHYPQICIPVNWNILSHQYFLLNLSRQCVSYSTNSQADNTIKPNHLNGFVYSTL